MTVAPGIAFGSVRMGASDLRVAIVHHWLVWMGGAEKVLSALCELYPHADLFTNVLDPRSVNPGFLKHRIRTSFVDRLPGAKRHYQRYVPLMPFALGQFDLRDYDLVISCEAGPAKGVITRPDSLHICYSHSPMRYIWDMYPDYFDQASALTKLVMPWLVNRLRKWDVLSSHWVDNFVANSRHSANRIMKYYRRSCDVIYPPVDADFFRPMGEISDYYLMVGRLVEYKRFDLAIRTFNRLRLPLLIIGQGPMGGRLAKMAGPTVRLLGWQDAESLRRHYAGSRALIFPGEEDFGIVPLEAMASVRPVIAYRKGGALESIVDGMTGLFFREQSVDCLADTILRYEEEMESFSSQVCVARAREFRTERFKSEFAALIERLLAERSPSIDEHQAVERRRLMAI
jgi:glycosyltransferase involved in cell wall biosynthesis